jgi:hypothetical protein
MTLPGTPPDEVDGVLATGSGEISTLFVSMARRHPQGRDAEYLRWYARMRLACSGEVIPS